MKRSLVSIDLGDCAWRIHGVEGLSFGTEEAALQYAKNKELKNTAYLVDTRPTLSEVATALNHIEGRYWDEGIRVGIEIQHGDVDDRWPNLWEINRIIVYVVEGGSEGFWLHVESIDKEGKSHCLLLGKTLDESEYHWNECWKSAGRIYRLLNNW